MTTMMFVTSVASNTMLTRLSIAAGLDRWCREAGLQKEREFDSYDFRFVRRNIYRALNLATLRLFRSFLTFEVQARYRRLPEED